MAHQPRLLSHEAGKYLTGLFSRFLFVMGLIVTLGITVLPSGKPGIKPKTWEQSLNFGSGRKPEEEG